MPNSHKVQTDHHCPVCQKINDPRCIAKRHLVWCHRHELYYGSYYACVKCKGERMRQESVERSSRQSTPALESRGVGSSKGGCLKGSGKGTKGTGEGKVVKSSGGGGNSKRKKAVLEKLGDAGKGKGKTGAGSDKK